ncbi:MAG TPA: glycosyl hydrolase, partial [Microlunatus sp.]|nr:glycosyl hydrolase [Microlunatus sp.]
MTSDPTFLLRRFGRRSLLAGLAGTGVAVSLASCGLGTGSDTSSGPAAGGSAPRGSGGDVFTKQKVDPLLSDIVKKTPKKLPLTRLADGLVPPTNRWFSGLAFGEEAQPVFPLPLSFGLTAGGFAFGLPTVQASEKAILGGYKPEMEMSFGAESARVSGYDTLTVTVEHLDGGDKVLGRTTIAQGSPFVRLDAEGDLEITGTLPYTGDNDFFTLLAGETTYGVVVSDGEVADKKVSINKGGSATWFVVPADGDAGKLAELAQNKITGSTVGYELSDDEVSTTLTYQADGGTAFAVMPHQQRGLDSGVTTDLGSYPSIYGTLTVAAGNELTYTVPLSRPTSALDLSGLSGDEKSELADAVTKDIGDLPAFPADTYFGGKALYRAAMLWQLATQLELTGPAQQVGDKLTETLTTWMEPKGADTRDAFCFVYDEQAKGIVGLTPSFGSDEFNDHHFHYGYFLYAAGVLTQDDPDLAERLRPVMDLVAADIGSNASNGAFPDRRVFDVYAGHSWASGTSPFADGNNQESSSEAITAWTGLAKWAKSSGNTALEAEAVWMLSTEAQAGLDYWTNFDHAAPVYSGYGHQIVTLNWGGKRDYATWFSPEPAAMLGILVIPMSPASTYLGGDPDRITANVEEATGGKFDQKFGDYLLMYAAL